MLGIQVSRPVPKTPMDAHVFLMLMILRRQLYGDFAPVPFLFSLQLQLPSFRIGCWAWLTEKYSMLTIYLFAPWVLLTDLPGQLGWLSGQFVKRTLIKLPVTCDSDKMSITNKWLQAQSFMMGPTCLLHTLLPESVKLHYASLILATLTLRVPQPLHLWTLLVTDHECHTLLYMPGYLIKRWVNQLLLGLPATELLLYLKKRLEANLKVPHSLCV